MRVLVTTPGASIEIEGAVSVKAIANKRYLLETSQIGEKPVGLHIWEIMDSGIPEETDKDRAQGKEEAKD